MNQIMNISLKIILHEFYYLVVKLGIFSNKSPMTEQWRISDDNSIGIDSMHWVIDLVLSMVEILEVVVLYYVLELIAGTVTERRVCDIPVAVL